MRRKNNRILRHNAEMMPVAPHDAEYVGKHENLLDSLSEIFEDICTALEITEDFIEEITAPARKLAEKITARVRKAMAKRIPMPEFRPVRNIWKGVVTYGIV